ncbi:hypothetical protein B296_00054758, partial [Ensete ventricosum]
EFRSVLRASSRNFKIQAIPNVFAHWKSYEHSLVKKYDGHKLYAKSCFDQFFMHLLGISKYCPSQCISPCEVVQARFHEKT